MFEQLTNLFKGGGEKEKEREKGENPELDKMGPALDKLKKEVDIQRLRKAVEDKNELSIVEILNPLEKLFKEVECPENGFTDPEVIEKKWLLMKEQIVNWLIEKERTPIDNFIDNTSNLTNFPKTKEEAEGIAKDLKNALNPKKLLFGGIIAWLTTAAATAKAKGGFSAVWGDIYEKLAILLGGKDAKKSEEEKKKALADKQKKGKKETITEAEKLKYEKGMAELKDIIELTSIPIAFKMADYKKVLKSSPFNGNAEALKRVVMKGSKENGGIWSLNENAVKKNESLKDGKFKFSLLDYLIPPKKLKNIIQSVNDVDTKNPYKSLADKTPNELRKFLNAVRTGEGLEEYKKVELASDTDNDELSARTPPSADT